MELSQSAALTSELSRPLSRASRPESVFPDLDPASSMRSKKINWRAVVSFFLLGLLIGLPQAVVTTGSNVMFPGMTGLYEVCASVTGAIASLVSPFVGRFIPYDVSTILCTLATALTYTLCTLPHPLAGTAPPPNKAAPIIGVMFGGFVYAYGTNAFMAAAAFFPSEAVLGLSVGSGCSIILGPGLYTAFMIGFHDDWRRTFLIFLPTVMGIPLVWWGMTDASSRAAAEKSRLESLEKARQNSSSNSSIAPPTGPVNESCRASLDRGGAVVDTRGDSNQVQKPGFGPNRTRTGLLIKTILPKYVLPLIICTSSSIVTLLGTAPTLQTLSRFRDAPDGNMQFQLSFLSYGVAQFSFSLISSLRPFPIVWVWTGVQVAVLVIGLLQLARPFLTYYGVWIIMLFLTGACVGGGVTNTNHKIAEDFRRAGEPDEVRSFAMSFAGLGNFGGDALGGAFGVLVQQIATKALVKAS